MENLELTHWGIKGMKWGRRRYQNKDGSLTPAGKKRYEEELKKLTSEERVLKKKLATKAKLNKLEALKKSNEEKAKSLKSKDNDHTEDTVPKKVKKSHKKMSEAELNDRIKRLELEEKYVNLNKSTTTKGKAFMETVLQKSGENLATQVLNHVGALALNKMISKIEPLAKLDDNGNPIDVIFSNNKKKS